MIALLSAMQCEIHHTVARIDSGGGKNHVSEGPAPVLWGGKKFTAGNLAGSPVIAGWTGVGTTMAGISCQYVYSRWRPEAVLFAGIGGGLNPVLRTGDVVAGDRVMQWDLNAGLPGIPQAVFPGEFSSSGEPLGAVSLDAGLREVLRRFSPVPVTEGLLLSGNSMVRIGSGWQNSLGGDAADMESISVALAGHLNGVPVLIIRIIADTAGGDAPADFRKFMDGTSRRIADIFQAIVPEIAL
ncbi:MAG: 5'-methylthioadenosine/S-adenosylhomocysteine nucleosidase [Spirochaetota bacterium]|nr:5'-methylthioadenosine/S-adenosylhomocysteine nucleosidase [Spirochaetota bacterium]